MYASSHAKEEVEAPTASVFWRVFVLAVFMLIFSIPFIILLSMSYRDCDTVYDYCSWVFSMLALIIISAAASSQFRLVEVLLFSAFLTAMCVVVFIWALGLPYELIAGIW